MSKPGKDKPLILLAMLAAIAALGLSIYLTILSLTGNAVAGCGAGSGCSEVLASKWSSLAGLPISAVGAAVDVVVLVGLGLLLRSGKSSRFSNDLLMIGAWSLILAACYYTAIQLFVIKAICPFCMTAHGIGVALGILVLWIVSTKEAIKPNVVSFIIAALGIAILHAAAGLTLNNVDPVRAPNPFADQDGDTWIDDARYVSLFGGELQFVLQDVPYIGDPTADHVVAVVFDYACPYCRTLHDMLDEAIEEDPSHFVLVPIPVSIHENHNPYIASDNERFVGSNMLAIYSMAAGAIDLEKYRAYDRWLLNSDGSGEFPRSANAAINKAVELFEGNEFKDQLSGNSDEYDTMLKRNIELLRLLPEEKRFIPITTTPGAPEHLTTRFDDIGVLYELLESAKTSE